SMTPRRVNSKALRRFLMRGVDPRHRATDQSSRIIGRRLRPSADVPEHRQILCALRTVVDRLAEGEMHARREIADLEADRAWRERPSDLPGTSLYERFDRPRIDRLKAIAASSAKLRRKAADLAGVPVLAGLNPQAGIRASLVT